MANKQRLLQPKTIYCYCNNLRSNECYVNVSCAYVVSHCNALMALDKMGHCYL